MRNTYCFFLRLAGFLVTFLLKVGPGTSHPLLLFVDAGGGKGARDSSFNSCGPRVWLVWFLLAVDCVFDVEDGRRGRSGDGERDCGCPC